MGYYILPSTKPTRSESIQSQTSELDRLQDALENGSSSQRLVALRRLISARAENRLVRCLASANPAVVQLAVAGLWECWLGEKGEEARREIDAGTEIMNAGNLEEATGVFSQLMARFPDWPEAINKLATARYLQNRPQDSIELCRRVVALKPDHFGAWNGLSLCAIQLEEWPEAMLAVQESMRLQPHSPSNRQLLSLVQSRLPEV